MLAVLILGSSVVGGAALAPAAGPRPAHLTEARPALLQLDGPARPTFDPPARETPSSAKTVCTIQVLRADPGLDRAMVQALERPVDPEMVVPSRCAP